jgi:hypothetical protein
MCVRKIHLQLSYDNYYVLGRFEFLDKALRQTPNGKCWLNSTPTVLLDSLLLFKLYKISLLLVYGCLIAVSKPALCWFRGQKNQAEFVK